MYKVYKGLMSPYLSAMFCLNETIHSHGTIGMLRTFI